MLSLLGSLLGFGTSFLPKVMDYFQDKQDKAHELALMDKQLEQQKVIGAQKLQMVNVEADIRQQDIHAVRSHGLRDAGAHLSRTDDCDRLVHRNFPSHVQQNACTSEGARRWLAPA